LFKYIFAPFIVRSEVGFQKIREEKELEDEKHYKQLDQDDDPHPVAPP
jgi:hypothetical protein